MSNIDKSRFPIAARYVDALPAGFASFPDCRIKSDTFAELAKTVPSIAQAPLPDEIRTCVEQREKWVPETVGVALSLMVRDELGSDEAFFAWTHDNAAELFRRPTYRMLMFVMSPSLVLMGAAKRWAAFREGTQLIAGPLAKADNDRTLSVVVVESPAGLYPPMILKSFAATFRAALNATRAQDVAIEVGAQQGERTSYQVSWS